MPQRGKYVAAVLVVFMLAAVLLAGLTKRRGADRGLDGGSYTDEMFAPYPFAQLTPKEKQLYRTLCKGIAACQEEIRLPASYTADEYEKVYLLVGMQQPEFFYLDQVYELKDVMRSVTMRYRMSKEEIREKRRIIDEHAELVLSSVPASASEWEKLLCIHDAVAASCSYGSGPDDDTMCGVLINGRAKCEGYAKALQYLARRAGLNSMCMTGISDRGVLHVWNIVRLDGNYYNVDVTWDDDPAYGGTVHSCFAVPDSVFGDHIPDEKLFSKPGCFTADLNWYQANGALLDSESDLTGMLMRLIRPGTDNVAAEIQCANSYLFERVCWSMQNDPNTRNTLCAALGGKIPGVMFDWTRQVAVVIRA